MKGLRHFVLDALALTSGGVMVLAFAPFGFWPLALAGLIGLRVALETASPGRGFWRGYLMGLGFFGLGTSWVFVSIHQFGGTSILLASLMVLLFVAFLALFGGMKGWLFAYLHQRLALSGGPATCLFAAVWLFEEWLRGWILSGFPWLYLGYAFRETWLGGWAPIGGVLFLSGLVLLTAGRLRDLIRFRAADRQPGRLVALVTLLVIWGGGLAASRVTWTQPFRTLEVALVQGNVDQASKWQVQHADRVNQRYLRLTEPYLSQADLVVWPEGALVRFGHLNQEFLQDLHRLALETDTGLVLGLSTYDFSLGSYFNSARSLGLGEGVYHKRQLVPFGEYLPFESWLRGTIAFFGLPMSDYRPGSRDQKLLQISDYTLGMAVCYEIVYPSLVRNGGQLPDLLATISNDSWFGESLGPYQHLEMAQMRALELGRDLLRATNDGVTALVGPDGRLQSQLPRFEAAVLSGQVQLRTGMTPYARFGQSALVLLGLALLILIWWGRSGRPGAAQR